MHPRELVKLFQDRSGLRTNHCGFNSDGSIEFDGFNRDGSRFHIQSLAGIADLSQETIRLAILQKNRTLEAVSEAINYGAPVALLDSNMAEKLPTLKSIPDVLNRAFAKIEDAAHRLVEDVEKMGDRGVSVIAKGAATVTEAHKHFEDVERSLDAGTNGGPQS